MSTSYPSAILCRDKALLVNLEHIKCIITSQYVLVLNADQVGPPAGCIQDECQHLLCCKEVRLAAHHWLEHWEFTAGHWPAGICRQDRWHGLRCHTQTS